MTNGVEYTVRVIATNAGGDGPPSQERTVAPNPKPEQLRQYIEEVVEEYEDSHPWLRTTWDYLQNNNIPLYVWDDVYDAPRSYYFGDSPGLSVLAMFVRSTHFDESTADAAEPDKKNAVLGKLALTYTLMNGVSSNPGPLGIAYMYFELFFQQPIVPYAGCNPRGLYLDVVMALLHDSFSGADHWNWCMERSEDATALEGWSGAPSMGRRPPGSPKPTMIRRAVRTWSGSGRTCRERTMTLLPISFGTRSEATAIQVRLGGSESIALSACFTSLLAWTSW